MQNVRNLCNLYFFIEYNKNINRFCNMFMGIAIILTIGVILLVATKLISKKCNQNLEIISNSFIFYHNQI
jgi:hypothetical protein